MAIRLSGLSSGLDTESIIKEMMSAQSMKKTKIENKLTKLEWKQDKWQELNAKIYALYTTELSKFKLQSSYLTKSVTSSDSSKATFKASSTVPTGTHSVEISQVATSQFITGNVTTSVDPTDSTKTAPLSSGTYITQVQFSTTNNSKDPTKTDTKTGYIAEGTVLKLRVGNEEKTRDYKIHETTTIADLTAWFKDNDISFTYDTTNQRFFLSSTQSGSAHAFTLESDRTGVLAENVGFEYIKEALGDSAETVIDLEALMNQYKNKTELNLTQDELDLTKAELAKYDYANHTAKDAVYKEYITTKFNEMMGSNKDLKLSWDATDPKSWTIEKVNEDSTTSAAEYRKKLRAFDSEYEFEKILGSTEKTSDGRSYLEYYGDKYQAGVTSGTSDMKDVFSAIEDNKDPLELLGVKSSEGFEVSTVAAQDMICIYNNNEYTSSSNTITINGLTINAIDKTSSPIKINVTNDTQAVYDMVKNFVTKYNEVLKELNDVYYADSAKGYDVLTEEERDAMTDEQIEKWENKIKDSLLRRDGTVSSLISAMGSVTAKTVTVNGEEYSLSSFGINTMDYSEKGLLHIYGNAEDSSSADETDRLMAALSADPDTVMEVLTSIGNELYSTLQDKMGSTTLSSALTVYNDKELASLKTQYEDEIDEWEERLQEIEDRYYSQFSAMETALSKLNAQTSYITSLFGGTQQQ